LHIAELYALHKNLVYNLALQYVQNTLDAEEITQDVFVAAHQKLHTFKHQANVSTWLCRIAINKSLDHIKAKKRKKRFAYITSLFNLDGSDKNIDSPSFEHPGIALENKEAMKRLFMVINCLSESQKTVLILLKIEGRSLHEVAQLMQISESAAGSLFARAKINLEKLLTSEEE
jgi:RNA polymerase sigma factor (sigma-70 family)